MTIDIIDLGSGTGFELPAGFELDLGPLNLFTVPPSLPRGVWQLRCAFEDPLSGTVQGEQFTVFELQ